MDKKFIIKRLDENFDACEQVAVHTDYDKAVAELTAIKDDCDYILVEIDSDGEEHLRMYKQEKGNAKRTVHRVGNFSVYRLFCDRHFDCYKTRSQIWNDYRRSPSYWDNYWFNFDEEKEISRLGIKQKDRL